MDPIVTASLVGLGGTLLSGLFGASSTSSSNATNLQAVRETNQAQMDLAKYQYEQNLAQWERENAYNSPSSQMQRLAQAGLNPLLVYGNQNAVIPAGNSPEYQAPNLQAYHQDKTGMADLGAAVGETGQLAFNYYMRQQLQEAQLNNLNFQNNKLAAETALNVANQGKITLEKQGLQLTNRQKRMYNKIYESLLNAQLANTEANTSETVQRAALNQAQVEYTNEQAKVAQSIANLNDAQRNFIGQQISESAAKIQQIYSEVNRNNEQAAFYHAQRLYQEWTTAYEQRFGKGAPWYAQSFRTMWNDSGGTAVGFIKRVGTLLDATKSPVGLAALMSPIGFGVTYNSLLYQGANWLLQHGREKFGKIGLNIVNTPHNYSQP